MDCHSPPAAAGGLTYGDVCAGVGDWDRGLQRTNAAGQVVTDRHLAVGPGCGPGRVLAVADKAARDDSEKQ